MMIWTPRASTAGGSLGSLGPMTHLVRPRALGACAFCESWPSAECYPRGRFRARFGGYANEVALRLFFGSTSRRAKFSSTTRRLRTANRRSPRAPLDGRWWWCIAPSPMGLSPNCRGLRRWIGRQKERMKMPIAVFPPVPTSKQLAGSPSELSTSSRGADRDPGTRRCS